MPNSSWSSTRRCPRCRTRFPNDADHFYVRPGNGQAEYCTARLGNGCHEQYWAAVRERRRLERAAEAVPVELVEVTSLGAGRMFGVEIEVCSPGYSTILNAMRSGGYDCNTYTSTCWNAKGEHCGSELVSPPLSGRAGHATVADVCGVLRSIDASTSVACGLHVHHDVSDLNLDQFKQVYRSWYENQGVINGLVAPSRRHNDFCRPVDASCWSTVDGLRQLSRSAISGLYVGRYRALNVHAYARHGTLEVRQHQGTRDPRKINARPSAQPTVERLLGSLVDAGELSQHTAQYLERRHAALNPSLRDSRIAVPA